MSRNLPHIFILVLSYGIGLLPCTSQEFLARREIGKSQFRVMNWNVRGSSILHPEHERRKSFIRMVQAVKPDIVCLQEVRNDQGSAPLVELMNAVYPLEAGQTWHGYVSSDCGVVSKYPITQTAIDSRLRINPAFCLVDLPDEQNSKDLVVINLHAPPGDGDDRVKLRQKVSDVIVSWIREARNGTGGFPIPDRTPMLILGDLNVLSANPEDPTHHLTTLLNGNILDEDAYGPDFVLDYDGSFLVEVKPRHNAREVDWYTWRSDTPNREGRLFPPDALDRILYTDSVLRIEHSYVLNTTKMTEEELKESSLLASDVLWEGIHGFYDHLPMVADFSLR